MDIPLNRLLVFNPNTGELFSATELTMVMNGPNLQLNLPTTNSNQSVKKSRKRKKDPKMKKALTQANQKLRNKNGSIKKGKSQSDIMKLAHRLRRKMK